jgi:hypothetical protein
MKSWAPGLLIGKVLVSCFRAPNFNFGVHSGDAVSSDNARADNQCSGSVSHTGFPVWDTIPPA